MCTVLYREILIFCAAFLRGYSYICSYYVLRFTSLILRYVVSWKFQSAFNIHGEEEANRSLRRPSRIYIE